MNERSPYYRGPHTRTPIEERFWHKVLVTAPNLCWIWTGAKDARGYGSIGAPGGNRTIKAHRLAFEIANGYSADVVMHTCDNPSCVNPGHLKNGTAADNVADMVRKGRHHRNGVTECAEGHPLSGANLIIGSKGERRCRQCFNDYKRAWRAARRAAGQRVS